MIQVTTTGVTERDACLVHLDNTTITKSTRQIKLGHIIVATLSALAIICFYAVSARTRPAAVAELGQTHSYRVFVTGFEPFLAFPANPSGEVALALNGKCVERGKVNVCFTGVQIPVTRSGIIAGASQAHDTNAGEWDAVLHLGLENSAKGLKFEAVAANVQASASGNAAWSVEVDPSTVTPAIAGAPWLQPTTAPLSCSWLAKLQELTRSRHLENVTEVWSRDAGTYFCNEVQCMHL
jgi:pyroglutamyl-peptidase